MRDTKKDFSAMFKTSGSGQVLFFPWYFAGQGYVVSEQKRDAIVRTLRNASFVVLLALSFLVPLKALFAAEFYGAGLLVAAVVMGWYLGFVWRTTRNMPAASERLSAQEFYTSLAIGTPLGLYVIVLPLCVAVALTFLGIQMTSQQPDTLSWLAVILPAVIAGLFASMAITKNRASE